MAKGISIDLIVDPSKAVKGIGEASGAAEKFTGFLKDLGKVGVAAVAGLATAVAGATTALTAATVSAAAYADEILTTATNTNISTDALQAYKYAAEQIDVSFDTFVRSQGKFTKSMQDAVRSGASPAAEAFQRLGIAITDQNGNLRNSEQVYWEAVDALKNVANETERTALAQLLWGRSGAEMNSLIQVGSEGFAELAAQARNAGAILSGEQLQALGAFDDKLQSLKATMEATKNAFGLTLLPILDQLAGQGQSALGAFTKALVEADGDLSKVGDAFQTLGTNIAGILETAVPQMLTIGSGLITGLLDGIVTTAPKLIETAVPLIVDFVAGIVNMLPSLINAGVQVLVALVNGVAQAAPTLIPQLVRGILEAFRALFNPENLTAVLDAGLALITGLLQGILAAAPLLYEMLPEIIQGIVDFLLDSIPIIIDTGITLLLALVENLPAIIDGVVAAIPAIITGIVLALIQSIPKIIDAGVRLLIALVENTPKIIFEIAKATPEIVAGIAKAFTDPKMLAEMAKAGMELIKGLWKGISDMAAWLWRQIQNFLGGILGGIKSFFGIASPSKVFAGIGENIVEGLEVGLRAPNEIDQLMHGLSQQVTGGFETSFAATARHVIEAGGGPGGGTVEIHLHGVLADNPESGRQIVQLIRTYVRSGGRGLQAVLGV